MCRKVTRCSWLLESPLCLQFMSAMPTPGPFMRAAVSSPTGLVNRRCQQTRCLNCSYRTCPPGVSTASCPTLVLQADWDFRKVGFLCCELECNVPEQTSKWKVVAEPWKMPGFLASGGEEFNLGPVMRLDRSELLCNKVLLKYRRDRESFWHRHQKGTERVPLLVFSWMLYTYQQAVH